jgi:hypothetical protein
VTTPAPYAYPCPACGTTADLDRGCPGCGRTPDPDAAEVIRLDTVIAELTEREQQWRQGHAAVMVALEQARVSRNAAAARVTAAVGAGPPSAGPQRPHPAPQAPHPSAPGHAAAAPPAAPEVSGRTVQTLLFILGGLLLGIGAIVFTAVAWTSYGVTGRAAILAVVTLLVLAVPVVARRRRLRGTAETFAVLGMLLLVLDGYAVWSVDLYGARGVAGTTWAGLVCVTTAAVALGYARGTRLTGPSFAALLLIQPVLPLLAMEHRPGVTGWAYVWAGLAAANLAVRWLLRGAGTPQRVVAWVLTGAALIVAPSVAVLAMLAADGLVAATVAGGALLIVVVTVAGVARLTGAAAWRTVTVTVAVVSAALLAHRLGVLAVSDPGPVAATVPPVLVAAAAAALGFRWRAARDGLRAGGLVAAGAVGLVLVMLTLGQAGAAVARAWPYFDPTLFFDWQLAVAVVALVGSLVLLLPAGWREVTAVGAALTALAAPLSQVAWWAPVPVDLTVAAVLAVAAVQVARVRTALVGVAAAAGLAGHALLVAVVSSASTAAALGALTVLGVVVAVWAQRVAAGRGPSVARTAIARGTLVLGLVVVPWAAAATVAAVTPVGVEPLWAPRAALASTVLLLAAVAVTRSAAPGYLSTTAAAVHVATPVAVIAGLYESTSVLALYAGGALLVLAATGWLRRPDHPGWWLAARAPVAALVALLALPQVLVVLFGPYEWLGYVWQRVPAGAGVTVTAAWPDTAASPVGLGLLAAAAAAAGWGLTRRSRTGLVAALPVVPVALLTGLAQLEVPWPVVPFTSLLLGLAAVLVVTVRRATPASAVAVTVPYAVVLAGAGLAGALPTAWSTLTALAVALAVAGVAALLAKATAGRVAGWLTAVALAVLLAVAASRAADLPLAEASLAVLAAATVALAVSGFRRHRRAESVALEAAAHAAAVVALLLTLGTVGAANRAALVAALWGVALGLRALWPGESPTGRISRVGAALGAVLLAWWLLLAARDVGTVEAYTVPAAVVAAGVGALALRARPQLGSWLAFTPALAAGFLPSLYASVVDPTPLRRLLLGGAAVLIVVVGSVRRWQAPVLVGGVVVALVAVRELVLVWQLLDTWVPLTAAGLVLVGLAATYERRRRDLSRLRGALSRMR